VADRLDVEAIRIYHERRVIGWMIMCSDARRAVVTSAMRHRGGVIGVNGGPVFGRKGDVDARPARAVRRNMMDDVGQPEEGLTILPIAYAVIAAAFFGGSLPSSSRRRAV